MDEKEVTEDDLWLSLGTVLVSISSSVVQRALKHLPSAMGLKPRSDCSHGTARSWRHICAVFCVFHSSSALFTAASFTAQGGLSAGQKIRRMGSVR